MRILSIIPSVNPAEGGPVDGMFSYAAEMKKHGWQAEAVSLDHPDAAWVQAAPMRTTALGPGVLSIRYTPALGDWILRNHSRFDVAVLHGIWSWSNLGGGRACRRAKLPYVVFSHGMLDPYFRRVKPLKHWVKQLFWIGQGPVMRDAARVLFTAKQEAELARGAFWGPRWHERIVKYGAKSPAREGSADRIAAFRRTIGLSSFQPYLLFLSRVHPKKGVDVLLEAFARIAAEYPELHLVVAGPDPDAMVPAFRNFAEIAGIGARVHFPGLLQGDLKWGAMEGAEAFTLLTHQENFGIVLAESLACSTPVITTTRTNIWQELEQTGAAVICDDTIDSGVKALRQFLSLSPEVRRGMRQKARAGYEARFTADAAAEDLMTVLFEVAHQGALARS